MVANPPELVFPRIMKFFKFNYILLIGLDFEQRNMLSQPQAFRDSTDDA